MSAIKTKDGVIYSILIVVGDDETFTVNHTSSLATARKNGEIVRQTLEALGIDGQVKVVNSKGEEMKR